MKLTNKIQAAVLSVALMLPASGAFAATTHHHRKLHKTHYTYTTVRHRHHYSQTRGAVVGAVAGAVVDHRHPITGALVGAAIGDAVQAVRNHHQ